VITAVREHWGWGGGVGVGGGVAERTVRRCLLSVIPDHTSKECGFRWTLGDCFSI